MDNIIKFIGTVSVLTYIMGILYSLVDFKYTHKAIRLVTSLCIITGLLYTFRQTELNINVDAFSQNYYSEDDAVDFITEQAAERLEQQIKNILSEKNISYSDVYVHINKQSESISVDCIEIYGVLAENHKYVKEYIGNIGPVVFGD